MILPITTLSVSVAALMVIGLAALVSLRRMVGLELGDKGEDVTLTRRIRAHGNFVEIVPLALMLIALVEISGNLKATIALAAVLLLARLAHAGGTLAGVAAVRGIGMLLTFVTLFGGVAVLAANFLLVGPLK
jgi:uncharacterized membrane protein YecN with MAPEG domain